MQLPNKKQQEKFTKSAIKAKKSVLEEEIDFRKHIVKHTTSEDIRNIAKLELKLLKKVLKNKK